jgi:hypothetical protein
MSAQASTATAQRTAPTTPQVTSNSGLDLLRTRVAFRDRSVADVLDLALRFAAVQGRAYAKVALVSLLPLALLSIAAGYALGWAAAWAIALPLAVLAEVPFTVLASRLVFQDEVRVRDVVSAAIRELPRIALARVIEGTLIAIGFAVLVLPGFWVGSVFLFQTEVMLLERAGVGQAIGRSQRLAGNAFSEVLLAVAVLGLVPIVSVLLVDVAGRAVIGDVLQFRAPQAAWVKGGSALATIGLFLQVPYLATARFFLYLNVRTRAEGWDIQTRFAALASRESTRSQDGALR